MTKRKRVRPAGGKPMRPMKMVVLPQIPQPAAPRSPDLRKSALRALAVMEGMLETSSVRMPYPGFLEAIVDLRRALKL